MHIPDGFIKAPTSLAAGAAAAGGIGISLRRAPDAPGPPGPLAGLVAAYIFAVQLLSLPVAAGTSGHLLGGALAAVLVGAWAGALCVSVVLLVQAMYADGGLSALGLNVVNMALVTAWGGFAIFLLLRRFLPAARTGVTISAGVAAGISVVLASLAFVIEYAAAGLGKRQGRGPDPGALTRGGRPRPPAPRPGDEPAAPRPAPVQDRGRPPVRPGRGGHPPESFWAFAVYGPLLAGLAAVARIPPAALAGRLLLELPFGFDPAALGRR